MRLISIGKSPSCTICIPNEYVSSYHAEIVLLDNGDIFLTDCNSKNGTFLNGQRINPNVEVPVRRGDKIEFDTVALNWGSVPQIPVPDPSKVKGVYGIGKSQRNRYNLSGDSVSRYHATLKEMKNGKWFIQDHSKNGTFINGNRIPANQDVQIKKSDSIVCGNIPCPNPVQGSAVPGWVWALVGGMAAAILLVICLLKIWPVGHNTDPYKATVLVSQTYRIKIKFADDPVKDLLGIDNWYFAGNDRPLATSSSDASVLYHTGTAFFISENGLLLTNKHVTNWIYADEHYTGGAMSKDMKTMAELTRQLYYEAFTTKYKLTTEQQLAFDRWLKSPFSLEIDSIGFGIRYSGRTYSSTSEMDWAHLVKESSDNEADVAIIRLNSRKTPSECDWFDLKRSLKISDLKRDANYYTLGFPAGELLATALNKDKYEPTSGILHLVQSPSKYTLFFMGDESIGGQSGSPIYDKKHRLCGVLYGGFSVNNSTNACPISHAISLVEEVMEDDATEQSFKSSNAY
ncbi:MAG: FHA domain-containing protein [Bacteroidales bacterium]|nr:FHA domain-containing protein [Bacteroidales bacterium]